MKPTVILDFDGVVHSYVSGWKGAAIIPDPPVEGVFQFIEALLEHFSVAIFSSRTHQEGGVAAMKDWFVSHGFDAEQLSFPNHKPPAIVSLDDRAICFNGTFPDVSEIRNFKTWQQ